MKTFTFDLKNPFDLLEIAKNISENNITAGDSVILQVAASTNIEFNRIVINMFAEPFIYCQFIDSCRTTVTRKKEIQEYVYPNIQSYSKAVNEFERCLTENTKIKFSIERKGNHYSYSFPKTDSLKEIYDSIFSFVVVNSIMPGDEVNLLSSNNELDLYSNLYYFHSFSSAINASYEMNDIRSINKYRPNYNIQQADALNFNLAERLSESGIKFYLNK